MEYCGCCGNEIEGQGEWCDKCWPHVLDIYQAPWNNTYYAQYKKACPFAVDGGNIYESLCSIILEE